jgi:hypothetical protein
MNDSVTHFTVGEQNLRDAIESSARFEETFHPNLNGVFAGGDPVS